MNANARQNSRSDQARRDARREGTDLDRNYGRIGISAVAAAARYTSSARDPAAASDEHEHAT